MFEQSLIVDAVERRSPWSFAVSITVQSLLVGAALVVPLLHIAKLDTRQPDVLFLPRQLGATEVVKQVATREQASSTLAILRVDHAYKPFQAPTKIPDHIAPGSDLPGAPEIPTAGPSCCGGIVGVATLGGFDLGVGRAIPVPPPDPPKPTVQPVTQSAPVRVGGTIQSAKLVFGPKPAYPPLARQARISGEVRLAARISADGHIEDLRVMSGHPMLVQSALDAVRQWVYKPTLLNGAPVEVLTDILVNFTLNQ